MLFPISLVSKLTAQPVTYLLPNLVFRGFMSESFLNAFTYQRLIKKSEIEISTLLLLWSESVSYERS